MQEYVEITSTLPFVRKALADTDVMVEIDIHDAQASQKAMVKALLAIEKERTTPKTRKTKRGKKKKGKRPKSRAEVARRTGHIKKLHACSDITTDRLLGFPRITLTNVIFNVPTLQEVLEKVWPNGDNLTAMERYKLRMADNANEVMKRFHKALTKILEWDNAQRKRDGKRGYPHGMFRIWVREFGEKNGRRHFHVVIGVNTKIVFKVGAYSGLPDVMGNLTEKIAYAWLEAIGLNRVEDNRPDNTTPYMGSFIYYPGKKYDKDEEGEQRLWISGKDKPYKSRVIGRTLTKADLIWLDYWISYMLKEETKEIPSTRLATTKETERAFGRSELIFTDLTEPERKKKRKELNKGRIKREKVPVVSKNLP